MCGEWTPVFRYSELALYMLYSCSTLFILLVPEKGERENYQRLKLMPSTFHFESSMSFDTVLISETQTSTMDTYSFRKGTRRLDIGGTGVKDAF